MNACNKRLHRTNFRCHLFLQKDPKKPPSKICSVSRALTVQMNNSNFTEDQQRLIDEILRVARFLGSNQLSQRQFDKHHKKAGLTTIGNHFGSWNEAVEEY